MTSELASNVVRHSAVATFVVTVERAETYIEVSVTDRGGGTPQLRTSAPNEPGGRGLQLIQNLALDWGTRPSKDRLTTTVWFRTHASARSAAEPSALGGHVVTASGSSVAEQRLALAVEAAQLGSWTWDMASGITTWDERLEEMHGLAPGGFGGTLEDWVAALHPDDRQACIARVSQALEDPAPYVLLHRAIWPDGSVHAIECRGTVIVDEHGRPTGTTGVAIDVTGREEIVQTFQHSLLPATLPCVDGVKLTTRYRAAQSRSPIGGDWYAAIPLADGRMGVAIGDVAGHGLEAVADMAVARFSLRALALIDPQPDVVLDRLNQVVSVFEKDTMITALYGVVDPHERTWTYASAGHVPALVRTGDGTIRFLDTPADLPLGYARTFQVRQVPMDEGSTLMLYTDGLIERRGETLAAGRGRLERRSAEAPAELEAFCDHVLDALVGDRGNQDDIALVALTIKHTQQFHAAPELPIRVLA